MCKWIVSLLISLIIGILLIPSINGVIETNMSGAPLDGGDSNNDDFGLAIAYVGDCDGGNEPEIVVLGDGLGGIVYEYDSSNGWEEEYRLWDNNINSPYYVESGLTISNARDVTCGDFNNDTYDDIVIGDPLDSSNTGRVYLFLGDSEGLKYDSSFDGANQNNEFGYSIDSGDFNGDGITDLLIGEPGYTSGGRVLIYFGRDSVSSLSSTWPSKSGTNSYAKAIDDTSGWENIGNCVRSAGDIDGDDKDDLVL